MSDRWYVHVQGPDDLIPADGMLDAMQKAHATNAQMLDYLQQKKTKGSKYAPLVWAVPVMPGDPTTAHITDDAPELTP